MKKHKRFEAAEVLADAVEDYVFATEKNLDKLRAAWQGYVDVADDDTALVAVVDADELERLLGIEARLDEAIESAFPDGQLGQEDLIVIRDGAS